MFNQFFPGYDTFVIIRSIVLALIAFIILKNIYTWFRNNQAEVISVKAKLVTKRSNVSGGVNHINHMTSTSYYMTFEIGDHNRQEFKVKGSVYGKYAEGDVGNLVFQGTRFLDFTID